jgi:hypothetical protein
MNDRIDIFAMAYEEFVSYPMHLETLEEIKHTNRAVSMSMYCKKLVNISIFKSKKSSRSSNTFCQYCDKNNCNMTVCRKFSKFKQQKKANFEANSVYGKKFWLYWNSKGS